MSTTVPALPKSRQEKFYDQKQEEIMRKRWISMLLALCLCIGMLSTATSAAGETRVALTLHVTDSSTNTSFVTAGQLVTLPLPVREGYIFDGWYSDAACSTGNGPRMQLLVPNGGAELWAKWVAEADAASAAHFMLDFDTAGGGAVTPVETTYGVTVDLAAYEPEREGYIFLDWYSDEACTDPVTSVMMTENRTVYAGWLAIGDAEASYQRQEGGEWLPDTLARAFAKVYDGGTIRLLKDVEVSTPIMTDKSVRLTSDESAQAPFALRRAAAFRPINGEAHLLCIYYRNWNVPGTMAPTEPNVTLTLDHIILDGGGLDGIVATSGLVTLGYTNLVLGEGASLQNNNYQGGRGGAVNSFGGNVTVGAGAQITGNEACLGGGIFADGGTVTITGGKIESNTSLTDSRTDFIVRITEQKCGAGIFIWSRDDLPDTVVELKSGSISGNKAGNYGGGVYVKANNYKTATFRMSGGTVKGNEARYGGGVYVLSSALEMSGGEITGNIAERNGGGVYYAPLDEHPVQLSGSPKIIGNTGNGAENNVFLEYYDTMMPDSTHTLLLTGALGADAEIGVTRNLKPTDADPVKLVAESAGYTITESDHEKFFSDNPAYTVKLQNGDLVITAAIRVGGLSVSPTVLTLEVGAQSRLTATVTPDDASNKTVRWTSDDETIASVDADGVVTAKAVGTVTITATTIDGQYTASCMVTVKDRGSGGHATDYYTLYFETDGGTAVRPIRRAEGSRIALNQTTEREGFIFTGWYLDEECTQSVDYVILRRDTTVYAGWWKDIADPVNTGVSRRLNTDEHIRYLRGYPDGAFGTDNNMTRVEAAQMFYGLLRDRNIPITVHFDDVAEAAWYANAVETLASIGVIKGVGNGKFAPERSITRAEFTAIAMRFAELDTSGKNIFSDVPENAWYYDVIIGSIKYGWISGYPDGTFRPDNTITRAEVTAIVNRMLGRSGDESYILGHADSLTRFDDLTGSHWAYCDIMEAANEHDYTKTNGVERWK